MKRSLMLALGFVAVGAMLFAASCSNPLEVNQPTAPDLIDATDSIILIDTLTICDTVFVSDSVVQMDTVFITDSMFFTDTLHVTDTVLIADTILVVDTLVRVDTVIVTGPGDCPGFCSQLGSHQKEIVWLLYNSAGRHRLDFAAFVERGKPQQTLIVSVGGKEYRWTPSAGDEFSIEVDLREHAKVRLYLDHPKACGHSIDVCLQVTPL